MRSLHTMLHAYLRKLSVQLLLPLLLLLKGVIAVFHKSSTQIALGGLSAALCLVVMLATALLPFATYALPALAGILLIPVAVELGIKTAWITYSAVSLLSLLIIPDRETALMFIAFFGYYPFLKLKLDRIKPFIIRVFLKLSIFNLTIITAYYIVINIFGISYLADELSNGFGIILLAAGNVCFPIYEFALRNMLMLYHYRIRNKLFKQ